MLVNQQADLKSITVGFEVNTYLASCSPGAISVCTRVIKMLKLPLYCQHAWDQGKCEPWPDSKIGELLMRWRARLVKELECVNFPLLQGLVFRHTRTKAWTLARQWMFSNACSSSANLACNIASFNGLQNEPQSTWKYTFDIGFCKIVMLALRQVDWCGCSYFVLFFKCPLVGCSPPHVATPFCAKPWQELPGSLNYRFNVAIHSKLNGDCWIPCKLCVHHQVSCSWNAAILWIPTLSNKRSLT